MTRPDLWALTPEPITELLALMSRWEDHDVLAAVVGALESVHLNNPGGHHFGRPFLTAYQLAIKVDALRPDLRVDLGAELGGIGSGKRTLARYVAHQLSRRIKRACKSERRYPVTGAFLSNEYLASLTYTSAEGQELRSSLTGTGYDLSIFGLSSSTPQEP